MAFETVVVFLMSSKKRNLYDSLDLFLCLDNHPPLLRSPFRFRARVGPEVHLLRSPASPAERTPHGLEGAEKHRTTVILTQLFDIWV